MMMMMMMFMMMMFITMIMSDLISAMISGFPKSKIVAQILQRLFWP